MMYLQSLLSHSPAKGECFSVLTFFNLSLRPIRMSTDFMTSQQILNQSQLNVQLTLL